MKNNITVKVVADSVNPLGQRITSFVLTYPRFIHSELMTHRMFSRNAASSRAIPIERTIRAIEENPAHPERWGTNGKGMQDHGTHDDPAACIDDWFNAARLAIASANDLNSLGLHKQIVNRVLEPFSRITTLVTATCYDNFFRLRAHKDAQPEFQVLAYKMLQAYLRSKPREVEEDGWHLPLVSEEDLTNLSLDDCLSISVANAARTSYTSFVNDHDIEKQRELADRLAESGHWSPFEHQAVANSMVSHSGNFRGGWDQYRVTREAEASLERPELDLKALLEAKPDWVQL